MLYGASPEQSAAGAWLAAREQIQVAIERRFGSPAVQDVLCDKGIWVDFIDDDARATWTIIGNTAFGGGFLSTMVRVDGTWRWSMAGKNTDSYFVPETARMKDDLARINAGEFPTIDSFADVLKARLGSIMRPATQPATTRH